LRRSTPNSLHKTLCNAALSYNINLDRYSKVVSRIHALEAVGDGAEATKDPEALTEVVRKSLTNVIARLFADQTGTVRGITIGARLESALLGLFSPRNSQMNAPVLTPESLAAMLRDLNHLATTYAVDGRPLPLITPPSLRNATL
jgi:flagellar biosynthesis protein FlhA